MHRLPSKQSILRFRLAAILLWLSLLMLLAAMVMFGWTILTREPRSLTIAIILLGGFAVLAIIQWIIAQHTKCPLCITPVLAKKNCAKNRDAKTLLGSYRLRASWNVLFHDHFRCPYCNEPTALQVRPRGGKSQDSRD